MADEVKKCAHETCSCMAPAGSKYCSTFCEDSQDADLTTLKCDCGHAGCEAHSM